MKYRISKDAVEGIASFLETLETLFQSCKNQGSIKFILWIKYCPVSQITENLLSDHFSLVGHSISEGYFYKI